MPRSVVFPHGHGNEVFIVVITRSPENVQVDLAQVVAQGIRPRGEPLCQGGCADLGSRRILCGRVAHVLGRRGPGVDLDFQRGFTGAPTPGGGARPIMPGIANAPAFVRVGVFTVGLRKGPLRVSAAGPRHLHKVAGVAIQHCTGRGGELLESRPQGGRVGQSVQDRGARGVRSVVFPHRYGQGSTTRSRSYVQFDTRQGITQRITAREESLSKTLVGSVRRTFGRLPRVAHEHGTGGVGCIHKAEQQHGCAQEYARKKRP